MNILQGQLALLEPQITLKPYVPLSKGIYGRDFEICPHIPSKHATPHDRKRYLKRLDPLETYDLFLCCLSAGKDSVAAILYLLELGISPEKIILIHHDIDGGADYNSLKMDWPATRSYCIALARELCINLKFSWREGGFASELFRLGPSAPISFEEMHTLKVTTKYPDNWDYSQQLKKEVKLLLEQDMEEVAEEKMRELKKMGYRYRWPAKTGSLRTRWCSSALKIEVFDKMLRYAEELSEGKKILAIDGIRREESCNRSKYNEIEQHSCSAPTKNRTIHIWRPVIDWEEHLVWEIIARWGIRPAPSYYLGFNRCSCALCIFSLPKHMKAIKEILPERYYQAVQLEKELNFTIDNTRDLESYTYNCESCIPKNVDSNIIKIVQTGVVPDDYIKIKDYETWQLPAGAYRGHEGGAC